MAMNPERTSARVRAIRSIVMGSAIFGAALAVRADTLYWTLDFDDPQSDGEIGEIPSMNHANPTKNPAAYTWLMMADFSGETIAYTRLGDIYQLNETAGMTDPASGGGMGDWVSYDIDPRYDSSSYRFYVELGNASGAPDYHTATWYTLQELRDAGYIKTELNPLAVAWNPAMGNWVVPEPSSGLLLLMGGALLALRRRRKMQ